VNTGAAGTLDGFTIVMGHEIEETVTDPGAEDVINGQNLGGWYDFSGEENATSGRGSAHGARPRRPFPAGHEQHHRHDGRLYPVQSLWSNDSAAGTGWCAGAATTPDGLINSSVGASGFVRR